jgi:hypothetical protein
MTIFIGYSTINHHFWDHGFITTAKARVLGGRLTSILLPQLLRHRQRPPQVAKLAKHGKNVSRTGKSSSFHGKIMENHHPKIIYF